MVAVQRSCRRDESTDGTLIGLRWSIERPLNSLCKNLQDDRH
jgi:hypothetical protein